MYQYIVTCNGHHWVYVFDLTKRETLIHQVYRDSRRVEEGFSLYSVFKLVKGLRE